MTDRPNEHPRFLTICLNPVLQRTLVLPRLLENEVNRSGEYYLDASGKGLNVTRVLAQLGERAVHLTQAGGRNRDLFLSLAERDGLEVRWVESGSEIRFCYTLLSREARTSTEVVEEAEPVAPGTEDAILLAFRELLPRHDAVIFSGTKAAGFSERLFPSMVQEAKRLGLAVILDVRSGDLVNSLPHRPDAIKPNFTEFISTFFPGEEIGEHEEDAGLTERVRRKMREIAGEYGCAVVLSRGRRGTLFTAGGGEVEEEPVEPVEPVNTTGSGDAFTAGLASVLLRGGNLREAVRRGHDCGRRNATLLRPGVIR